MERKYRQRGYMDRSGDREEKRSRPAPSERTKGSGEFSSRPMPGFHDVIRCAICGAVVREVGPDTQCPKCQAELHSCKQCRFFDTAARYECTQPIPERVARKNARNNCTFFQPTQRVERETSSASSRPDDARTAFEKLFKK
ncbi:MAG: hypothetical protein AB1898_07070 [Acidobacteriota bacterium]